MVIVLGYVGVGQSGLRQNPFTILVALFVPAMVLTAGNAINDVCDASLDAVGRPWRPVPAGSISKRSAIAISLSTAGLAITGALATGVAGVGIACLVTVFFAYAYSFWLKRIPLVGNLTVAAEVAAVPIFAGYAAGTTNTKVSALSVPLFLGFLLFELAKTASDRWYDQIEINTLATAISAESYRRLMIVLTAVTCVSTGVLASLQILPIVAAILLVPVAPIAAFLATMRRRGATLDSIESAVWLSKSLFVLALAVIAASF